MVEKYNKAEHSSGLPGAGESFRRKEIIERIKKEIQTSTYKIKSQEIAEKIGQRLKEDERLAGRLLSNDMTID